MSITEEIKQERPFAIVGEEVVASILRTSSMLDRSLSALLRPFDITSTQYNILRILRGSQGVGLCRYEIGARMLTQVPDVTRLLDRMEAVGLVVRMRGEEDRRVVRTEITQKGLDLLDRVSVTLQAWDNALTKGIKRGELTAMLAVLDQLRAALAKM